MKYITRYWRFEFDKGKTHTEGKADWPDRVTIYLDRRKALDIIANLAMQLKDETEDIYISLPGEMEKVEDEEE